MKSDTLTPLTEARVLLEGGQIEAARGLATAVLKSAEDLEDRSLQGKALLALSQFDRVLGHFRRAIDTALRAAHLFQIEGDIAGEACALSLLSHVRSCLGRDEEAVETALLSVKLGNLLPAGCLQVSLYNYLGVAYLWANSFADAERALRECERLALLNTPHSSALLPRVNLAWLEAVRLFKDRYFTGRLPSPAELGKRLDLCADLLSDGAPFTGLPGVRAVLQRFGRCAQALHLCWSGQFDAAHELLAAARDCSKPGTYARVTDFFCHWVAAELRLSQGDFETARGEAKELIAQAGQAEFEQMAYIGHVLLIQIYRDEGLYELALNEERDHRLRELRVRSEILESRHAVVQTQLDIRTNEHHLQQLMRHSQELERLSYEDALTGLANRRRFEMQLASALGERWDRQFPVCVAFIDLDSFKGINDCFTHAAGDEVLKAVAQAICVSVRESDLPARLGGDEFVVLFCRTTLEAAREVCDRIHAALAELRWHHLSPTLRVTVSIGVSQAHPGDTPSSLLQRSDVAMFEAKKE